MTFFDYELEDEVTGESTGIKASLFRPLTLWYILMIVIIVFGKGRLGMEQMDKAFLYGTTGILLPFIVGLIWTGLYHRTAKVVWQGGHSTTSGRIEKVGNFAVIRLDGLRSGQIEWQQNKGILIAPSTAVEKKGNSIVIHARCIPQKYERLPRIARNHIRITGYKQPFVMGYVSEEQYQEFLKPDETPTGKKIPLGSFITYLEDLQEENTRLETLLGRELGMWEDVADLSKRVHRLSEEERKGITAKIKEKIVEEKE